MTCQGRVAITTARERCTLHRGTSVETRVKGGQEPKIREEREA